ncbi:MAG: hypothetical protein ACI4SZ_06495 [Lachnospiraceae bacterium]
MAVGKGSVARAAKAAPASQKATAKRTPAVRKTAESTASAEKVKAVEIAAPTDQVMAHVVYETNNGMLERDAEPNESFGLGDPMPVYYF